MLMAVNEPYALMVQPDDILISPREMCIRDSLIPLPGWNRLRKGALLFWKQCGNR